MKTRLFQKSRYELAALGRTAFACEIVEILMINEVSLIRMIYKAAKRRQGSRTFCITG